MKNESNKIILSTRCAYIDALKGFAILLVVMGHVLALFPKSPLRKILLGK